MIDAYDILLNGDESLELEDTETVLETVEEAFEKSCDGYGYVDVCEISRRTGLSCEDVVQELGPSAFQCPEVFENGEPYDITKGHVKAEIYLSGLIPKKLACAERMNDKYPHCFDKNVEALRRLLPTSLSMDDIYVSFGSSWIKKHPDEIAQFAYEFLDLEKKPEVVYHPKSGALEIVRDKTMKKSDKNVETYGVRSEGDEKHRQPSKQYLTAIDIIEDTANGRIVKVFDYDKVDRGGWDNYANVAVLNYERTVEAQEKQKRIEEAFRDWIFANKKRRKRFEQYYNDEFVGYTYTRYDGSHLKFPGLNPNVKLKPHQSSFTARVIAEADMKKSYLVAHDVGSGKGHVICVTATELKRLGKSSKNLVVVPNNTFKAIVKTYKRLYKNERILEVSPKRFNKDKIGMLEEIRDGDYTVIFMAYSSFDMIVMSKQYNVDELSRQIRELRSAAFTASTRAEAGRLTRRADHLEKRLLEDVLPSRDTDLIPFESLGINTLIVDEAHNYKNIPIYSRLDNVIGMHKDGSDKCREMLEKTKNVDRTIFLTGTPLSNSIADLFTFQTYLQPETLKFHGIDSFDTWISTFGQKEECVECDVDVRSETMKVNTRFTSFHNLTELMAMFSQVCDFYHVEGSEADLPAFDGYIDITLPRTKSQDLLMEDIADRNEKVRLGVVSRKEDNLLKITSDGRMIALDPRLSKLGLYEEGDGVTKTDRCAEEVYSLYKRYPGTTQLVFSDLGTPKASFNVYDELRRKLEEYGIPSYEIAYAHDAVTDDDKIRMMELINKGSLRVVIGSTRTLGVGLNIQERCVALHHLDVPWKPSDMIQREGRILRSGNTVDKVFIYRYITVDTFDAYSWEILERKQKFISSFLGGTSNARDMNDIDNAVLNYAEVKALAIGNPLIRRRVDVANALERSKILCRRRQRDIDGLKQFLKSAPGKIDELEKSAQADMGAFDDYFATREDMSREELEEIGAEYMEELRANVFRPKERWIGDFQGFSVIMSAGMRREYPHVILAHETGGRYYCKLSFDMSPLACCKAIIKQIESLGEIAERKTAEADKLKAKMKEAKQDLALDNKYFDEIASLTSELAEIDKELDSKKEKKTA